MRLAYLTLLLLPVLAFGDEARLTEFCALWERDRSFLSDNVDAVLRGEVGKVEPPESGATTCRNLFGFDVEKADFLIQAMRRAEGVTEPGVERLEIEGAARTVGVMRQEGRGGDSELLLEMAGGRSAKLPETAPTKEAALPLSTLQHNYQEVIGEIKSRLQKSSVQTVASSLPAAH